MFAQMMASSGGGGNIKSGTTEQANSNGTITIDTGLSEINQFVWFAESRGYSIESIITYDKNIGASVFDVCAAGNNGGYHKRAIGAATTSQTASLTSISGGTVVLTMSSGTAVGNVKAGVWFAQ